MDETQHSEARKASGYLYAGLGALCLLTYYPLLPLGFADHDSMFIAIRMWSDESYLEWASKLAQRVGRWHYYYAVLIFGLPYLSTSFAYFKVVTLGLILLNAAIFFYALRKSGSSVAYAVLTFTMFLLTIQIGGNHSGLTSVIHVPAITLFLTFSILYFYLYMSSEKPIYLFASTVFYALALPLHETVVIYLTVHICLFWSMYPRPGFMVPLRSMKPLVPFAVLVMLYGAATLVYRQLHPSEYVGNTLTAEGFSVVDYFKAHFLYTIAAFPMYFFFDEKFTTIFQRYAEGYLEAGPDLRYVFSHLRAAWIIRATVFVAIGWLVLRQMTPTSYRRIGQMIGLGVLLTVIPNSLLSLNSHYQNMIISGTRISSHLTYFANFGVALILSGLVCLPIQWSSEKGWKWLNNALAIAVLALMGFVSLVTDFSNHYAAHMISMNRLKWEAMDAFMETDAFKALPEHSVLLAPSLWEGPYNPYYQITDYSGGHLVPEPKGSPSYWSKYIGVKTGRVIDVVQKVHEAVALLESDDEVGRTLIRVRYMPDSRYRRYVLGWGKVDRERPRLVEELTLLRSSGDRPSWIGADLAAPGAVEFVESETVIEAKTHHFIAELNTMLASDEGGLLTIRSPGINLSTVVIGYLQ